MDRFLGRLLTILALALQCLAAIKLSVPATVATCEEIVVTLETDTTARQLVILGDQRQVVMARLNYQDQLTLRLPIPSGHTITFLLVDRNAILASSTPQVVQTSLDTSCYPAIVNEPQLVTDAFWQLYGKEIQQATPKTDYSSLPIYFYDNVWAAHGYMQASAIIVDTSAAFTSTAKQTKPTTPTTSTTLPAASPSSSTAPTSAPSTPTAPATGTPEADNAAAPTSAPSTPTAPATGTPEADNAAAPSKLSTAFRDTPSSSRNANVRSNAAPSVLASSSAKATSSSTHLVAILLPAVALVLLVGGIMLYIKWKAPRAAEQHWYATSSITMEDRQEEMGKPLSPPLTREKLSAESPVSRRREVEWL